MKHHDTIVAPITAMGGAVAIVRLSGPDAWEYGSRLFDPWPQTPQSHVAVFGRFVTGDDGLVLPFAEGKGYTGEQAVEFSVHGSRASVRGLLEAAQREGARMAKPGEFTLRAFMHGKLDLSQAESVRDTVTAQTDLQLRFANAHREGAIRERVASVRDEAFRLLAAVEASVDFSDEVGELDRQVAGQAAERMERELGSLLETERLGRILRHGLRIALVGEPNAGKSSLLNALLKADRAIVTPIPGTTRDTIEESIDMSGIPCVLIDTAGLRETEDVVEREGVARSERAIATADVVWYVHDATQPLPQELPRYDLMLMNKADLAPVEAASGQGLATSAITGAGLAELASWISGFADSADVSIAIDPRHVEPLTRAMSAVREIESCLRNDLPDDLLATCLREAIHALGEITGETASVDMIERIFRDFCIGK